MNRCATISLHNCRVKDFRSHKFIHCECVCVCVSDCEKKRVTYKHIIRSNSLYYYVRIKRKNCRVIIVVVVVIGRVKNGSQRDIPTKNIGVKGECGVE